MNELTESPAEQPAAPPRRRSLAGPVLAVAILCALGGWAYWRFVYWPSTPQYALTRFFEAAKAKDYDAVYDLVRVPGTLKAFVPNGTALKAAAKRLPGIVPQVDEFRVGAATIEGDHATVEATTITRKAGQPATDSLSVRMVRTAGIWRIDGNWIAGEMSRRGLGALLLQGSGM